MIDILQPTEKIKAAVERQLVAAQREADAYAADAFAADPYRGTDLDTAFQAEADFDFLDVTSGELRHDPNCPFCRVRKLQRAYGRVTSKEEIPHGKTH
jgi:hypothetical protein